MTLRTLTHHDSIISGRMEPTPEGFLICRDVALARTGEQNYAAHEIPGLPAKNGRIIAIRDDEHVFDPAAIESFRGKPLTDDHPFEDVDPQNWKQHIIGTVMNPRRGEGAFAHCVVGDLIVYDAAAIAKIKGGKRELSCGYDAGYEVLEPGRARQINIRGNHVSLVDEGRCGPTCAIRDRAKHMAENKTKSTFRDLLVRFGRAKDEAEREEVMKEAEAMPEMEQPGHEGDGHHITLNLNGNPAEMKPRDAEEGEEGEPNKEETGMDEDKVKEVCGAVVAEAMQPFTEALKALSDKLDAVSGKADEMAEAMDDLVPEDMEMQDAIARAEILAPGLALPARDAKPGSKAHRDALGGFQRAALKHALTTDAGRAAVTAVLGHAQPHRIATMDAASAAVAFRGASTLLAGANAAQATATLASATSGYMRDDKGQRLRPMTTQDLSDNHKAFYAQRRA